MKLFANILGVVLCTTLLLSSCGSKEDQTIDLLGNDCMFLEEGITAEPVCSFNPSLFPTSPFPVWIIYNGESLSGDEYKFEWSSDADFSGSAISVTYEMLPLTIVVTEVSTDCTATSTLTSEYWQ